MSGRTGLAIARSLRALSPAVRRSLLRRLDRLAFLDRSLAACGQTTYTHAGRRITVDAGDRVGREMLKNGFTEQPFVALVRRHFTDVEGCFLDIGANLGNYALALAPHYRQTYAFEPNPVSFRLLQQNAHDNPSLGIEPIRMGLSAHTGTAAFYPNNAGNSGASGLEKKRPGGERIEVEIARGDDFLPRFAPFVAAIKIDVEGHELDVLRGLERTLERDRPVIFMEWLTDTMRTKGGFDALRALLPDYALLVPAARGQNGRIKTAAPKHRLTLLTPLAEPHRSKYNLVFCVPRERADAIATHG
ncbi:methyltransferase FkbM [Salinisphaera orenii MK-B5]|uniref:Methyltransferase FkbM n=1 Tax=Salinisphaera orenii MK-B5 TaxID=856730 RepID=A0A423PGQ4_9GAMM|nr:FkbM family methyltransferase [Salinisphaera orenii]ROO24656.1 methyltransferase FkbM [Salinisphaera orenii MK-B5]